MMELFGITYTDPGYIYWISAGIYFVVVFFNIIFDKEKRPVLGLFITDMLIWPSLLVVLGYVIVSIGLTMGWII